MSTQSNTIIGIADTQRPTLLHRPGISHVRPEPGAAPAAPALTYLDALARWARERRDAVFLDFEGKLVTFGAIDERSTQLGHALSALGVRPGDRVATMMDNSDDSIICFFAINKAGAIWVPINTAYRGAFLKHQLGDSGAGLVICDAGYRDSLLGVAEALPALGRILVRGVAAGEAADVGTVRIEALDAHRDGGNDPFASAAVPGDIACLMYTSGTTGPSKGCILTHSALASTAGQRNRCITPDESMITWSCLPLFHTAATCTVLLSNLIAGARVAIASRFSVSGFWDEIERSGATSINLLASMLPLVAHAPDTPAMLRCRGQVRYVTGVPLSAADRKIWEERFGAEYIMSYGYGQTEANMVSFLPFNDQWPPLGSMGPPADEFEVMVVDDDNRPVPIGQTGELVVRPTRPGVMFSGYWGRPQDTLNAMQDLWWHTGDFVRMDETGYLYFVDRKKDYLRSRGENISSFEVESALLSHPAVAEVACHTIAGQVGREEELKTTAILREGAALSERALFEWSLDNLPYFAVSRFIEFRTSLPKTPTGRVQKDVLRTEGRTAATWDCEAEGLRIRRR